MGRAVVSSALLVIFNILYLILTLALVAGSIFFFIHIQNIVVLRNSNHYKLDYSVNWPQAVPWMFILPGVLALIVSFCGFLSVKYRSRSVVTMYTVFQIFALLLLTAAAIVTILFADTKKSDDFITDTIWDAFGNMKDDKAIEKAFGQIEKDLQCCGAMNSRDYTGKRDSFPMSCCESSYSMWKTANITQCSFHDKLPNERLGCSEVARYYVRMGIRLLAGTAIFTVVLGIFNLGCAFLLSSSLKKKKEPERVTYRPDTEKVKRIDSIHV